MAYLADTNVLLRSSQPAHPMHAQAASAVQLLLNRGEAVCILPQNVIEFWNAATRPADRNGLGLTPAEADQEATRLESLLILLSNTPAIYPQWRQLVVAHSVSGVQVHDAHLVAAMLVHGVTHILTFNGGDFQRYPSIAVVPPQDLATA